MTSETSGAWPSLEYSEWGDTAQTLHLCQAILLVARGLSGGNLGRLFSSRFLLGDLVLDLCLCVLPQNTERLEEDFQFVFVTDYATSGAGALLTEHRGEPGTCLTSALVGQI